MYTTGLLHDVNKHISSATNINQRSGTAQLTALHRSVDDKFYEPGVVAALVNAGIDPNAIERNHRTPLHYARHPEAIAELIACGADPNFTDVNQQTPLHVNLGKEKAIARMDRIHALIDGGADLNARDYEQATPFFRAIEAKRPVGMIETLVERGADIHCVAAGNQNALCWSTAEDSVDVTQMLIDMGVDLNRPTLSGKTPLACALAYQHYEMAEILLSAGADASILDVNGANALHHLFSSNGVAKDRSELARKVMDNGADINAQDRYGNTPLHNAASLKSEWGVRVLLDNGADTSLRNAQGTNAQEIAYGDDGMLQTIAAHTQRREIESAVNIVRDEPPRESRWRRM